MIEPEYSLKISYLFKFQSQWKIFQANKLKFLH